MNRLLPPAIGSTIALTTAFTLSILSTPSPMAVAQTPGMFRQKPADHWIARLEADNKPDRWYAAYALGQIGPDAPHAVEPLQRLLENRDQPEYVRGGAAWALGRIGPAAASTVPLLIENIESKHLSVRRCVPVALGQIGKPAQPAVPALLARFDDEDWSVRVNAAEALWRIDRHPAAIPRLIDLVQDGTGTGPYKAAVALGTIGPDAQSAVPTLIEAQTSPNHDLARAAARALRLIRPKSGL